jgi:tetratricopeptide (TPR) repeat protein
MGQRSNLAAPLKLELVDDVPRAVTTEQANAPGQAIDIGQPKVVVADIDPHLAQATREHARGVVDPALWERAVSLASGDEGAAVGPYLRARATMLKLAQQRRTSARRAPPQPNATNPGTESPPPVATTRSVLGLRPRAMLLVGACGVVAVLAVATWMWLTPDAPPVAAAPVKAAAKPQAPVTAPVAAMPANTSADFAAKIEELRNAGNWNVLVLHAAEWTRKDPGNAAAWAALGAGYAKLGQIDESFEAAKRAVALDGSNPAHLRRLADTYVELDRPADALIHVEKLVALDERDADALAQAGTLYLALGRLPDARNAFDRALGLDPSNRVSSCGAIEVARRQGRTKDADMLAKSLKGADCGAAPAMRAAAVQVPTRASPPAPRR